MTYRALCALLTGAGIESAEWEAQCLLRHFFSLSPSMIPLLDDRDFDTPRFMDAVKRRTEREPLQYILGTWDFYRQTYEVSPDCLIPRSDTEILVETAIRYLPAHAHFADLCTGSGCIAVSVLAERPDTRAIAVDKFESTLSLATRNATKNGVSERFTPRLADVLEEAPIPDGMLLDAILCNPPYIPSKDVATLAPEVHFEPYAALDGGEDGLLFYRRMLRDFKRYLKPDGWFLFEIGFDQGDALRALSHAFGYSETRIFCDLGGNDRVALIADTFPQERI